MERENTPPIEIVAERAGRYILTIERPASSIPFIHLRVKNRDGGEPWLVVIPALAQTRYLLECKAPASLEADLPAGSIFNIRRAGLMDAWPIRKMQRHRPHASVPLGLAGTLLPLLARRGGHEGRELTRALRLIKGVGLTDWSRELLGTLMPIRDDFALPEGKPSTSGAEPRFVVVLHLHYRDLWPEFEFFLKKASQPFHLIVTITAEDEVFSERVRASFPQAEIIAYPNRGRDVGPFMQLLHEGRLDGFDLICKMHGKKSGSQGTRAVYGDVWRRVSVCDLIGDARQVERILALFAAQPDVGMIGPDCFRIPNAVTSLEASWGKSRDVTLSLAAGLGFSPQDFPLDFFAGTMFWVRRSVLEPLKAMNLTLESFPAENGSVDGDIQHGLERVFGALPARCGMHMATIKREIVQSGEEVHVFGGNCLAHAESSK